MLALALLLLGCAALQSNALPALVQYQAKDELGQYSYGYSGGPSAKQEARTLDGVTRGSYSYIDGNGIVQTRSYEADDLHGFRVVGTDIAAPTGVSRSGTILSSTSLPVYDHKTYQPVYYKNGYDDIQSFIGDDIQSFRGNEISISPVPSSEIRYNPYSIAYLKNPYRVHQPAQYYQQHYISPNNLEVSPLSSVGIRIPPSYQASYSRPIAYSDSGVQSTATQPTIVSTTYTPTYHTTASKIVSSYVPKHAVSYSSPISFRAAAIANSNPAPISYLDAAQSTIPISNPNPTVVAYTRPAPIAEPTVEISNPSVVAYTRPAPIAEPTVEISNPSVVAYTRPAPIAEHTVAISNPNPTVVDYTPAVPAAVVSATQPSVAVYDSAPLSVYNSAQPVSYSTPLTYGYYPTTSSIVRYASAAPTVRATVYEPAGGYLAAKPVPLQEAIATQYHAQDELGQYRYGYSNINSAKEESKTIDGVTRGSFSYIDANGVLQSRSYVSDDVNGFRVIGTDIPKDPNGQVNPDAIPSERVAPSPGASTTVAEVPVAEVPVHSAVDLPSTIASHDVVHVNSPVVVSSTAAPFSIFK